jgi:hypothetical protein
MEKGVEAHSFVVPGYLFSLDQYPIAFGGSAINNQYHVQRQFTEQGQAFQVNPAILPDDILSPALTP